MELNDLFDLWDSFYEKYKDCSDPVINEDFHIFKKGTPIKEIIDWFSNQNPNFTWK